ncbi:hypothetical protein C2E23DRAFT_716696 [Lenzites betulinus]|nr:hypothetical protein C2E23DRAFT_716696 [Lenzites betulinus]
MQSYSNPDVFFCPLYNPPGVSDPISSILSGVSEHWPSSGYSTPITSRSTSPSSASPYSTPPTSRENSPSPPPSPPSSSPTSPSKDGGKRLQKYRRMCAMTGKPLLDFVTELEGRKLVHEKRKQVRLPRAHAFPHSDRTSNSQLHASQSSRNSPLRAGGSDRC